MISVIGLGFVGLTTAIGFGEKGYKVFGYDQDNEKADLISKKQIPFFEPHLEEKLCKHFGNNFELANSLESSVAQSEIIFLCVGTPTKEDGSVDLTYLLKATGDILKCLSKERFTTLVVKSTVPPSTLAVEIAQLIEGYGFSIGEDIGLATNPEFLREGFAWLDFIEPDRIVIGAESQRVHKILRALYEPFQAPVISVNYNTAEFIKYLSNTLLSTLISFSNDMSMIAGSIGDIDIPVAFKTLHGDKRWHGSPAAMSSYVYPGCGFGGYCLPKDTQALGSMAEKHHYRSKLLESVMEVNKSVGPFLVDRLKSSIKMDKRIAILGLSFKPSSDDVRETPSAIIIHLLLEAGYENLIAYDPLAIDSFRKQYSYDIEYGDSLELAIKDADAVVILTAWQEFREKKELFREKKVFDFRYFLGNKA
jgi:UDPglucose 6-dehydrogenase